MTTKRKPSMMKRLKDANEANAALTAELERVRKELDNKKLQFESAHARAQNAETEISDLHALIDTLPGAIEKRAPDEYRDRPVMTRLAAWFATRGAGALA